MPSACQVSQRRAVPSSGHLRRAGGAPSDDRDRPARWGGIGLQIRRRGRRPSRDGAGVEPSAPSRWRRPSRLGPDDRMRGPAGRIERRHGSRPPARRWGRPARPCVPPARTRPGAPGWPGAGRQEVVDERVRGLHAGGERLVVGRAGQGVQPDQAMAVAPQPRRLAAPRARDRRGPSRRSRRR